MAWCAEHEGEIEYVLEDRSRVDCLTKDYAIEFEFGPKWAEAVGQALYYALKTGRKPGIVLILENSNDNRYFLKLKVIADKYDINLWVIDPEYLKKGGKDGKVAK